MMPFFISGDWPFFFTEQIKSLSWAPSAYWMWANFGENAIARLWLDYPFRLIVKLFSTMGLSWMITEKLMLVAIALGAGWSMYQLSGVFFKEKWSRLVASSVYVFNSYFFLVLGGGQLGVAAAYTLAPFALRTWIRLLDSPSFRKTVGAGLVIGLLVMLDLRIAYLCTLAFALYSLLAPRTFLASIKYVAESLVIAASLHLFWLFPAAAAGRVPLPQSATGAGSLSFFSVADFSHALSLLHPNWPENLFGRVYFQQSEFLILPILAFSALFFIRKRELLFFPILGLIGIFLAKGVNPPAGGLYELLFTHVPGFLMFRDPTKFYLFIALSYAILIPFTLSVLFQKRVALAVLVFGVIQIFLLRDALIGRTSHSFQFAPIFDEYSRLKDTFVADATFSRVLWLPRASHFAYFDDMHPFVDAEHGLGVSSPSAIAQLLREPDLPKILSERSIGYLVVPADEGRSMFLDDYTYDESKRKILVDALAVSPFMQMDGYKDIAVFRNPMPIDLFTVEDEAPAQWQMQGVNSFDVIMPLAARFLTMHVLFDSGWRLRAAGQNILPTQTPDGWTRFELPGGTMQATVYFALDEVAKTGAIVSGFLLMFYIAYLAKGTLWKH